MLFFQVFVRWRKNPLVLFNIVVSFEAQKIYSLPVWEQQLIFKIAALS